MQTDLPKLIEGSVKNIYGIKGQDPYVFEYSDRYSIFDWGEMPDLLKEKGQSLAYMAHFFFKFLGDKNNWCDWECAPEVSARIEQTQILAALKKHGVAHHYKGDYGQNIAALNRISVTPVKVNKPTANEQSGSVQWDYQYFQSQNPVDELVPLEVIFRFGVPQGSSLLKRTGDLDYCAEIGLANSPQAGDRFTYPVIEMSTKLETTDRYINQADAKNIAGLSDKEAIKLKELTEVLALRLKDIFKTVGIELWDGKFEFAFIPNRIDANLSERDFMLVDSIGPDELRLTYNGISFSKENLRQFYAGSSWKENVEKAKDLASTRGVADWKGLCIDELKSTPEHLAQTELEAIEMMYKSLANTLSQKYFNETVFKGAWPLTQLTKAF